MNNILKAFLDTSNSNIGFVLDCAVENAGLNISSIHNLTETEQNEVVYGIACIIDGQQIDKVSDEDWKTMNLMIKTNKK